MPLFSCCEWAYKCSDFFLPKCAAVCSIMVIPCILSSVFPVYLQFFSVSDISYVKYVLEELTKGSRPVRIFVFELLLSLTNHFLFPVSLCPVIFLVRWNRSQICVTPGIILFIASVKHLPRSSLYIVFEDSGRASYQALLRFYPLTKQ